MRILKFRGYDKQAKQMTTNIWCNTDGPEQTDLNENIQDAASRYELMQFTELLDKSGVEIWEGDLVTPFWAIDSSISPVVVTYLPPRFILKRTWQDREYPGIEIGKGDAWQVIGNIYEHNHLLETK